ncbi:AAA family ATPase [Archangium gephyra]|nr:AAA family ATPase [Archangium gephyra]
MFFDNIKMSHFGPFPELTLHFNPKGVNAIIGPNASGKTQLLGAIAISLFGEGAKANSERTGESTLRLEIRNGQSYETLNTRIEKNKKSRSLKIIRTVDASPQQQVSTGFNQQLLKMLAGIDGPNLFLNREAMSHPISMVDGDIERIDQIFEGDPSLENLRPQIRGNRSPV